MAAQFTIWDKIRLTADMKETQLTNLAKFISHLIRYLDPVLRIRTRDPVLFDPWFRDPDGKNPDFFLESIETVFRVKNT
jgi:hypothetical protein